MNPDPTEMIFPDHFSDHAARYEAYRPSYPDDLFAYVASLALTHDLACDCATGNGQAALGLTRHFRSIVALDATRQQLDERTKTWLLGGRRSLRLNPVELTVTWRHPNRWQRSVLRPGPVFVPVEWRARR